MNMLSIKRLVSCLVISVFFLGFSSVGAVMRGDATQQPGSQGQTQGKAVESTNTIRRATELVQRVQNGVLYTDKNQYDLRGVKVIDHMEGKQVAEPSDGRKRVAEMIFVNDTLYQVIIHK
jgi:hypothetical protein